MIVQLFAFRAFYDWAGLSGHLYHYATLAIALGGSAALTRLFQRHHDAAMIFLSRTLPALAGVVMLAFVGVEGRQGLQERQAAGHLVPPAPAAPNVLLLVVDTLRADHLSGYGRGFLHFEDFAFLNYMDVHDPYLPPQPYRSRFSRLKNPGGLLKSDQLVYPPLSPDQLQGEIDAYDGGIAYLDDQIAQLLSGLRQAGAMDNTIVIVTADHGESFAEHGLFLHQNALYRELIHVPLIVVGAGRIPEGIRVGNPVSNVTLPATVMDLIGATGQTIFQQPSLSRWWGNPVGNADQPPLLSELAQFAFGTPQRPSFHGATQSLISGRWHFIVHEKFGIQLYDWQADPAEVRNLAQRPDMQETVTRLRAELAAFTTRGR